MSDIEIIFTGGTFTMDKDVWVVGEEVNFTVNFDSTYPVTTNFNIIFVKDFEPYGSDLEYTISELESMGKLLNTQISGQIQLSRVEFESSHLIADSDKSASTITPIIFIFTPNTNPVARIQWTTLTISEFMNTYPDSCEVIGITTITFNNNSYWLLKDLNKLWSNNDIEYTVIDGRPSPNQISCRCRKINKLKEGTIIAFMVNNIVPIESTDSLQLNVYLRDGTESGNKYIYGTDAPISGSHLRRGDLVLLYYTESQDKWIILNIRHNVPLIDDIYPVGSIYMSVNSTNPSTLFGGTWEQLKDRFLLGSGDTYANGSTGGSATVTLTSAQSGVPAHSHKYQDYNTTYTLKTTNRKPGTSTAVAYGTSLTAGGGATERTSSNNTAANASQAHENMPPYLAVYMWKRIA